MTIENVKITNTNITMEDHGVLTFYITVEGAGIGANLGGYCIGSGYLGAKEFSAENGGDWMINGEYWHEKSDPATTHWMSLPKLPKIE